LWWFLFETGSHKLFAQGWLWMVIPLISASWVARITGTSPGTQQFFVLFVFCYRSLSSGPCTALARQALYHLSHSSGIFCVNCF
jgi:hypothetical protein